MQQLVCLENLGQQSSVANLQIDCQGPKCPQEYATVDARSIIHQKVFVIAQLDTSHGSKYGCSNWSSEAWPSLSLFLLGAQAGPDGLH